MDAQQKELLMKIMETEFTAIDLNLYLDTHPDDRRALADYNAAAQELASLRNVYESRYGPILPYGLSPNQAAQEWRWINEPWPWKIIF